MFYQPILFAICICSQGSVGHHAFCTCTPSNSSAPLSDTVTVDGSPVIVVFNLISITSFPHLFIHPSTIIRPHWRIASSPHHHHHPSSACLTTPVCISHFKLATSNSNRTTYLVVVGVVLPSQVGGRLLTVFCASLSYHYLLNTVSLCLLPSQFVVMVL